MRKNLKGDKMSKKEKPQMSWRLTPEERSAAAKIWPPNELRRIEARCEIPWLSTKGYRDEIKEMIYRFMDK